MRGKVLIIESNATLASLWKAYLVKHGFDAFCSIDGPKQAEGIVEWGFPDVIVSGLDFTKKIPSASEYCVLTIGMKPSTGKLIPVIQLFSSHIPESVRNALKGSAFKLMAKPVSLQALLDAIREATFESFSAALRSSGAPVMSAKLEGYALAGILQEIEASRKSGTLLVESQEGKAWLAFKEAEVVDACCGSLSGGEAILEALSWNSGSASLHNSLFKIKASKEQPQIDIKTLLSEALRQREIMERATRLLASPSTILQRNPSAKICGKAPFSDKIYIALESPCDFETLLSKMKQLSRRQLLVSLTGMVERGEVVVSCNAPGLDELNTPMRRSLIEHLLDATSVREAICAPPTVSVTSFTPRAARFFLGAACGLPSSPAAFISAGGQHNLLLCERTPHDFNSDSISSGGLLVIFDRSDSASIGSTRDFLAKLPPNSKESTLVLVPHAEGNPDNNLSTAAELLGLESDNDICNFEFTRESCAASIAQLLKKPLERSQKSRATF